MFKNVRNVNDIAVCSRFIDKKRRCVCECVNSYQLGNSFEFVNVDNPDDIWVYTIGDARQNLLVFNLSDNELRAVLCMSMFEFIEFCIYDLKYKGGDENDTRKNLL